MCKVKGCNRLSVYKNDDVCQMHYFRYMRNETYDLKRKRKYRHSNDRGYQLLYIPDHPLSHSRGYVYEHRYVIYDKYGENIPNCQICGKETSWEPYFTHIDHIDNDVTNNDERNLRVLCNACNTVRGKSDAHERVNCSSIEYKGKTMTAHEWSKYDFVKVTGRTIRNRIASGWTVHDALTVESRTLKKLKQLGE